MKKKVKQKRRQSEKKAGSSTPCLIHRGVEHIVEVEYVVSLNTSKKKKKVEAGNHEHHPNLKRTYSVYIYIYIYIRLYRFIVS